MIYLEAALQNCSCGVSLCFNQAVFVFLEIEQLWWWKLWF